MNGRMEHKMQTWGILAPDDIPSSRRLQSLGLTRAVRHFNEKAVPGMGGIWFAMPLIWSVLGISLARQLGRRPIDVANAIEALAMKLALGEEGAADDATPFSHRIRGRQKLPRVGRSFKELSKRGAYVTQPFRQGCGQPLVMLGLVEGNSARFNSFELTPEGERLLAFFRNVQGKLKSWIETDDVALKSAPEILPDAELPKEVRGMLARRLRDGIGAERRIAILTCGRNLTSDGILDAKSNELSQEHWKDLKGGVALGRLRKEAVEVLDAVEGVLVKMKNDGDLPKISCDGAILIENISQKIEACRSEADSISRAILEANDADSTLFLIKCQMQDPTKFLRELAKRDGVVIVLRDDHLVPGPAFGAARVFAEGPEEAASGSADSGVPELPRIARLLAFIEDLEGSSHAQ